MSLFAEGPPEPNLLGLRAPANLVLFLLIGFGSFQQSDFVDLTPHAIADNESEISTSGGCQKLTGGVIGDGWPETEDHQPRQILVQVVSTRNAITILGGDVEAVVRLQNMDSHPIQIPWSTDAAVIKKGQTADSLEWESASFEFTLKNKEGQQIALKSLTRWLHGSRFVPSSLLKLQPGASISAAVKFTIVDLYPIDPLRLKEGEWQLSVGWIQVGRTLRIKDCQESNGYFHYDRFYKQQSPPFKIQIRRNATKSKPVASIPNSN